MKKIAVTIVLIAGIVAGVSYLEQPTDGVQPVVWGEATCAHCQMHDDPGCLFEWVAENAPSIKNAYFRHYRRESWLDYRQVGFVEVDEATPMGYGLGAVLKDNHPEAMSFEEASNAI
ncbi:MAG: hypothetical protein ABEN55_02215, partial [Bradymonadaceae bacterium]